MLMCFLGPEYFQVTPMQKTPMLSFSTGMSPISDTITAIKSKILLASPGALNAKS